MDKDLDFGQNNKTIGLALRTKGELNVISYILYEPARRMALNNCQDVSMVLGHIMAHEIGHLLGIEHENVGLMKARFEPADLLAAARGELFFFAEDARKMREAAAALASAGRMAE